jgi:uncharacterized protein YceH (UPF0502 family)
MTEMAPADTAEPNWTALTAKQRRVLGTLMEKSKTTPDVYPMTFAALTTGCNQKTNRAPISNYTTEQVEQTVDELKKLGAVTLVHGSGRVEKVRHYAYQWLGLSKVEAAIMTELLLRGHQTIGELRTRASRLEPISDLGELQRLLEDLASRRLVLKLTPAGRGQWITHNLYPEWELEELQKSLPAFGEPSASTEAGEDYPAAVVPRATAEDKSGAQLVEEVVELRQQLAKLTERVDFLERELGVLSSGPASPTDD